MDYEKIYLNEIFFSICQIILCLLTTVFFDFFFFQPLPEEISPIFFIPGYWLALAMISNDISILIFLIIKKYFTRIKSYPLSKNYYILNSTITTAFFIREICDIFLKPSNFLEILIIVFLIPIIFFATLYLHEMVL
ncbi:MAG: hypothetical protein QXJ06_02070 [Candidatus Aenigmatarchaeota archaeon]